MRKLDNHNLNPIPKYGAGTYSRYYNSTKYYNTNSSKHRNYCPSSEDEKTNSKSNNFLLEKNKSTNIKNKYDIKINSCSNTFCKSQKFFNDYDNQTEQKYKNTITENLSRMSNHTCISLNSLINGNNYLQYESEKKSNINYTENYNTNVNISDKYNNYGKYYTKAIDNKKNEKQIFNNSQKLIENHNNNINRAKYGTLNQEKNYKLNSSKRRNSETINIINDEKKSSPTRKNNLSQNRREKNLSINLKENFLNINKKNVITMIPNKKIKNDKIKKSHNSILNKNSELSKIKKLSLMSISNFSNLNDSSQKNPSDKNNHSFYEVKSLSREFPHQQTEILISEANKIKNNNSVLNLSNNKNIESNLKQNNNINTNKEANSNAKNNFFKLEAKNTVKDLKSKTFNLSGINKYLTKEKKVNIFKENKKSISIIINKGKINNINNNGLNYMKNNISSNYNSNNNDKINIGNILLKKREINNNMIKLRNDYKISKLNNIRNNIRIETYLRMKKFKANKINSYSLNYISNIKPEKNKKNKKFVSNKKLMTLKNLNYKTFEEDFPLKLKNYKRYKYTKYLKPQISVRITLFNIEKLERKRYFHVNFFYSENIRNLTLEENYL